MCPVAYYYANLISNNLFAMALSVKLSSSLIRPFGFSAFSRQNGVLVSSPIISHTHQHSCLHFHSLNSNSSKSRPNHVPINSHQFVFTRSVSNDTNHSHPTSSNLTKNERPEAVVLAKCVAKENEGSNDDQTKVRVHLFEYSCIFIVVYFFPF